MREYAYQISSRLGSVVIMRHLQTELKVRGGYDRIYTGEMKKSPTNFKGVNYELL